MRQVRGSGSSARRVLVATAALVAGLAAPVVVGVSPAAAAVSFGTAASVTTGSIPYSTVSGDFNGDGKIDLATANYGSNSVTVSSGNGLGTFTTAATLSSGGGPTGIATGYFNADARLDLVTANYAANTASVFLANTTGGFNAKADYAVGSSPWTVAVGETNADGRPDLVTANYSSHTVSVLRGTGSGTFNAKTDYATDFNPGGVALTDVNGDTRADIITSSAAGEGISVLLATSSGNFNTKADFGTGSSYSARTGDVNGDGKVDVVTAAYETNQVKVWLGNGAGSFGTPTVSTVGSTPYTAALADLNGDGKLDIVAANYNSTTMSVLEQNSGGTYAVTATLTTGIQPFQPIAADVNADGGLDLLVPNAGSSSVSRFLNGNASAPPTISGSRSPAANANGWNNENVIASFTCGGAGLATCTSPVTVSAEGANQSVTGTATNGSGQSATATVSNISIDKTLPTLSGVAAQPPNAAGWYRDTVGISWTCSDALSGIVTGTCPATSYPLGEGSAVTMSRSVSDNAGNQRTATSQAVKIDYTRPSTGVSSPPTWSNTSVTLALSPVDALSGVASTSYKVDGGATQTGSAPVVSGQGTHTVQFWSTDVAGNVETAQSVQVRIDVQAPSITAQRSVPTNAAGWNNGPVTISFTCSDEVGGSGVASCSSPQGFTTEVDTTVTGNAADVAGNTASVQAPVRIDQTAPTVTAQVPAANANGWFNEPVEVPFSCVDTGGSGVATCPVPVLFAGEGADQPVTGTGTDLAGNEGSASGSTVSLDTTAPTISGAALNDTNGSGGYYGDVLIRWTCDDALSGIVACPADVVVSGEGVHDVTRSTTDRAGNTTSAQVTVRIDHDPSTDPGIVHGTITDSSTGLPVPGASVTLRTTSNAIVSSTTTGTDGTYTFPMVADGTYKVYAVLNKAYQGAYVPGTVAVGHGTNATVDQALAPTLVISGTVRTPGGAPVSGATVRVGPSALAGITDATGSYRIPGNLPGATTVRFFGHGSVPSSPVSFNLTADRTVDQTLQPAAAGGGVKGTITNRLTGAPIPGATVRVWAKDSAVFGVTVTTGADGRYSLASLPVGSYEFDVGRGDFQTRWFGDVLSRANALPITVTASCTSTPDTAWGDPCAVPAGIRMG